MAVGSSGLINGTFQVQHFDQALRTQVKVFPYQLDNLVIIELASAERVNANRRGFCDANRIRDLNFCTLGQAGGDNILCYITACISRRSDRP